LAVCASGSEDSLIVGFVWIVDADRKVVVPCEDREVSVADVASVATCGHVDDITPLPVIWHVVVAEYVHGGREIKGGTDGFRKSVSRWRDSAGIDDRCAVFLAIAGICWGTWGNWDFQKMCMFGVPEMHIDPTKNRWRYMIDTSYYGGFYEKALEDWWRYIMLYPACGFFVFVVYCRIKENDKDNFLAKWCVPDEK